MADKQIQTQPVPIRIDTDVLLVLLAVVMERQGGNVSFTFEDINKMAASGKTIRVVAEAQKDPFGNVIYNYDTLTPVVDPTNPLKAILHQLKPARDENGSSLLGPDGGLVN